MRTKTLLLPTWFNLLLLFLPIVLLAHIVWLCGINVVYMDDFEPIGDYIKIITTGSIDWNALIALHNEHRIVFPRIIMHIIAAFTHYNTKFMMMFSVFLLSAGYLIFIRNTLTKTFKNFNLTDIFISIIIGLCLFSFCQQENLLWGFQIAWFLIEFCVIAGVTSLVFYIRDRRKIWIVVTLALGFISSFSALPGLAIWPCYLVVIALSQFENRKLELKPILTIAISALIVYIIYFSGYSEISYHSNAKASSLTDVINFFFMNLGCVLIADVSEFSRFIVGLSEFILTLILGLYLLINRKINDNLIALGVIAFSLGISLMLGIGRSGWTMPSRYMTFPLLAVIGNMAILYNQFKLKDFRRWLAMGAFAILACACLNISNISLSNYNKVQKFRVFTAFTLANYRNMPLQSLRVLYPFKTHEEAIKRISEIEKNNLSTFYDLKRMK